MEILERTAYPPQSTRFGAALIRYCRRFYREAAATKSNDLRRDLGFRWQIGDGGHSRNQDGNDSPVYPWPARQFTRDGFYADAASFSLGDR